MYSQNKEGKKNKILLIHPIFFPLKIQRTWFYIKLLWLYKMWRSIGQNKNGTVPNLFDRTKMEQSPIYLTEQKWNNLQSIRQNKNGTVPNLWDRTKMEQSPLYLTEQKWNSPQSIGQNKNGTVPNLLDRTKMEQFPIYWTEQKWNSRHSYNINKYNLDIHTFKSFFYITLISIQVFWYAVKYRWSHNASECFYDNGCHGTWMFSVIVIE